MHLKCNVVWLLVQIAICQCRKNRLVKIENKVDNITKTATSFNKLKPSYFLFHSSKPWLCTPSVLIVQPHRMASVQKETWPSLGCCCLKMKSMITHRHDLNKPGYFLFQDSTFEVKNPGQCMPSILIVQPHRMASTKETRPGFGCCYLKVKSIIACRHNSLFT